jgi:predicted flap endonuclease-1-like 5' DNA nuclease
MSKNSFARFTAKALIVGAVILLILGMIPVIAVAVGGLGAGWAAGSRLWAVGPLACCACSGALFLLAFGAMLLILTRIQGNLGGWRQRQIEAAQARAVDVTPEETKTPALAAGTAAPVAAAPQPEAATEEGGPIEPSAEAPAVAAGAALAGAEVVAEAGEGETGLAIPEPELGALEEEAGHPGRGAVLAGAGVAAAAVLAREEEAEPTVPAAEAVAPQVETGAPEAEGKGPGLGVALAGAGIAAVAAVAHDERTETTTEEAAVTAAEAEATVAQVEEAAPEAEPDRAGLGMALAGAGVAAAVAAAAEGEENEPEPTSIPESAPEPEPGAPLVEILEAEEIPPSADEAGVLGSGDALAAAGLAAVAHEGEQEGVTIESVVLEPDSSELQAEAGTGVEATTPEVEAPAALKAAAPAAPARPTAWAYDEGTSKVAKAVGVQHTQGVGQVYAGKLKELGITTTAALLRAGSTPKGRKELAEKTGISPKQILKWVNHVDLARIKGISEQYADLLEWAGVDTVPALAQRNADNLLQKITEVNEARRLVRRLPTLGMVASWIAQAKELPRIVVYK